MSNVVLTASLAVAAVLLLLAISLRRVPPGHSFTINRAGRFHRTLGPGWHLVVPLLDRVTHRISTVGEVLPIDCDELKTQDSASVRAVGRIYVQVLDPRKAAYHSGDLHVGAHDLTRRCCDELIAQLTLEALEARTPRELNIWLMGMLNQTSLEWGVRVTRVELTFKGQQDTDQAAADA